MKLTRNIIVATVVGALPCAVFGQATVVDEAAPAAGQQTTTVTKQVNPDGSTRTRTVTIFTPAVQSKVTQYFDAYKAEPYGLPPTIVKSVPVAKVPQVWRTRKISQGYVIPDAERTLLVAAPADLVQVLPAPPASTKYYVMGRNVVAVDTTTMKVVEAVSVPTITYDDGETTIKDGNTTTTIDEDGEIETEVDDDDDDD